MITEWQIKTMEKCGQQRFHIKMCTTFKNLNATGLKTRKGDGLGRIILPVQQVSYGPLIMSINAHNELLHWVL